MNKTSKGLYVAVDDLQVGKFYAIVNCKLHDEPIPIAGNSFQLMAIQLPFIVGRMVCDPNYPPETFNTQYLNIMEVDEEFVNAQRPQPPVMSFYNYGRPS